MKHFPASFHIKSTAWARLPPTGRVLARELASAFESPEYVAEIAMLSGRSEQYVAWHLSMDTVVPACLLTAVLRLRNLHQDDEASHWEIPRPPAPVHRHG